MTPIRVGAVGYLNARPLVEGLDRRPERFAVRFDVPSRCAALLHEGAVDIGLIPSIEYLQRADYRIVPGVALASRGPVASVALFTPRPTPAIRSVAVDSSSRTSAALLRILCARWFDIEPKFVTMPPDLTGMLKRCDAALLIGDAALYADHHSAGLDKIDLGEEWTAMTGLPFVWAFWAGRADALTTDDVAALQRARDEGLAAVDRIAAACFPDDPEKARIGAAYLRNNIHFYLDEDGLRGLARFYEAASDLRLVPRRGPVRFYGCGGPSGGRGGAAQ
jgi:chorismate dehydratase